MKNNLNCFLSVVLSLSLFSCSKDSEYAKQTVERFFLAATDSTKGYAVSDFYPDFDSLEIKVKTDVLDIEEKVIQKNDTFIVHGLNNYTDERGVFRQDSVSFYLLKKGEDFRIIRSFGLVKLDKEIEELGISVGVLPRSNINDRELKDLSENLLNFYQSEFLAIYFTLYKDVSVVNWNWEESYSGTPNGEAWIKNNSNFTVKNIHYEVIYFDHRGNVISTDKGSACDELHPGERYRFSFYSSHVKYPAKARIKLDLSRSLESVMKQQVFTKEDFDNYCTRRNMLKNQKII